MSIGNKKAIKLFIEKGAHINAVDKWKMTPLHYIPYFQWRKNWTEDDSLGNFDFFLNH